MSTVKSYWENHYRSINTTIRVDNWLSKYKSILNSVADKTVIDLGCGWGNNTGTLLNAGIKPVACDISVNCINYITGAYPEVPVQCFDMSAPLPFETESTALVIADLSLHYFNTETTINIIHELHRILVKKGHLLCRINSTKEINNKGEVFETSERNLYKNEGITRRFFDRADIVSFFTKDLWVHFFCEEYEMDRYNSLKWLWEIALQKR